MLMGFAEGRPQTTAVFNELLAETNEFAPTLVILETAADLFGGNENDRGQVRQFLANCCAKTAVETAAAVLICAHPSVAGLKSGEGSGGSTAWNNTLRSRFWLRRDTDEHDQESDTDIRLLELKKANFAARGTMLRLRWRDGAFEVDRMSALRSGLQHAREVREIVEIRYNSGIPFSAHPQAGRRWLGAWVMDTFRNTRKTAARLVDDWIGQGLIAEVREPHRHRSVLC